ncbi:MAG: MG2 domain-containing protein [Armatimonadota bacterium]|nr:MG2 domain-containing protein [Armatimonadota bacterium]
MKTTGLIVATLAVAIGLAYGVSQQVPVGRLEGDVTQRGTSRPVSGARVVITPSDDGVTTARKPLYALARPDGRFTLAHVPAGQYQVSAYLDAYTVEYAEVRIDEGRVAHVRLALDTARPELQLVGPRRLFTTRETVTLPLRGHVDASHPAAARKITIRVFRTRLSEILKDRQAARALDQVGVDWRPAGALPDALLRPRTGAAPSLVLVREVPITGVGVEGFYTMSIDLGAPGVGLYLIEARYGTKTVSSVALVTDTALVLKRTPVEILTFVADVATGVPAAGSTVTVYRDGEVLGRAIAATNGLARFRLPAPMGEFHLTVVAQRGRDEAVVAGTDYRFEESGDLTLFAYTDRPIYRPGQRIFYKALVRRKTGAGLRYAIPSGQRVTVEVRDPSGEPIFRERRTANALGAFHGRFDLSEEAPTGTYALVLTGGGTTFTHDIAVASYRKPEFSVTVRPDKPRYVAGDLVTVAVSAQFYFGAPVAGGSVRYSVYRSPDWLAAYLARGDLDPEEAEEYAGYRGDGRVVAQGEARLDAAGQTTVSFPAVVPDEPTAPADQIFAVQATVTDSAGREVYAEGTAAVVAGAFRLFVDTEGYLVQPRSPTTVRILARDHDGNPVARVSVTLEAEYEIWDSTRSEYVLRPFRTKTATTGSDGTASVEVTIPRGGYVRLTARATDTGGRTIRDTTFVWAADASTSSLPVKYAQLSLLTDKRRYTAGETARVLINTDRVGQTVLLTVEGAKVYRVATVPITTRSTVVTVPILPEYGRNAFLGATYVRDKRLATDEVPLSVALPQAEVRVSVRSDRPRYAPGDRAMFIVRTTDTLGRPVPAEISLGVVDESIYALREDDPYALRNAFYPRRWNMVRTSYSYELRYLGDADKAEAQIAIRRRFRDIAHWAPEVRTDASGQATVSVDLPDNLTTWRATVMAHTADTRVGRGVHKILVSKEFFVRIETPRLFSQHDRSRVLALIHNETDTPQQASVHARIDGLIVEGAERQTITIGPRSSGAVTWPVYARQPGAAKIVVTAFTTGSTRRTDGIELTVPIRPHGRDEVVARSGEVAPGVTSTETLRLDAAAIPGSTRLALRVTPSVTNAVVGALDYLVGYPYGCVEQTMSRFLPTVLAQRALRTASLPALSLPADIPHMVRDGMTRLYRLQHGTGGWGWWEFDDDDPWMTAYALYGLAVAKAEGYPVRTYVLEQAQKAALELVRGASPDTQMFLLYAVALSGGDVKAVRSHRAAWNARLRDLGSQGVAYAALLDRLLGADHRPAIAELGRRAVTKDGTVHWPARAATQWNRDWDWNDRMATAVALRAILTVNPRDPRVGGILRWMMRHRTDAYWGSTRDTAWILAALTDDLRRHGGAGELTGEIRVRLNGQVVETVRVTPEMAAGPDHVLTLPAAALRPGDNTLALERTGGGGRVFYTVQLRQVVGMEEIPEASSKGIRVAREYLRIVPKTVGADEWSLQTEPSGNQLRQGDRVLVRLTIATTEPLAYLLIEDPFPAGFEVTERGSAEMDEWHYWWASTDVRDDRIVFFIRSLKPGTHTIEYNLRAQTPGRYQALPAVLQGMYNPERRAESAGARVVIK